MMKCKVGVIIACLFSMISFNSLLLAMQKVGLPNVINSPGFKTALQQTQQEIARKAFANKSIGDIANALEQSQFFKSAIDHGYEQLAALLAERISQGEEISEKIGAAKIKGREKTSYAKLAAIAALAGMIAVYGGVDVAQQQGSTALIQQPRGGTALWFSPLPQSNVSGLNVSPTEGVVLPEISAAMRQAETEPLYSPYVEEPEVSHAMLPSIPQDLSTASPSEALAQMIGGIQEIQYNHIESSVPTLDQAIIQALVTGKQSSAITRNPSLILVDGIKDQDSKALVVVSAPQKEAEDAYSGVIYYIAQNKLYCAPWKYKGDPTHMLQAPVKKVTIELAVKVEGQENNENYNKLIVALGSLSAGALVVPALFSMLPRYSSTNPHKVLKTFSKLGSDQIMFHLYQLGTPGFLGGFTLHNNVLLDDGMWRNLLAVQRNTQGLLVRVTNTLILDEQNIQKVIIAIHPITKEQNHFLKSGWMYYEKNDKKLYFREWNSNPSKQEDDKLVLTYGDERSVDDKFKAGYERLWTGLNQVVNGTFSYDKDFRRALGSVDFLK
jgi:hypothetical protein